MKHKGKMVFLICVVMVFTIVFSGCGGTSETSDQNQEEEQAYKFSIAHIQNDGDPGDVALQYLAEILEERTDGKIETTVYGNKSLAGSDTELGELVRQNSVQCVPVPTHTLAAMADIPQYKVFEFPYLFSSWNEIYTLLDSEMADEWAKVLEDEAGVCVYDGFVKGWLSIGTKKGPMDTPADFAGQKIRTMATDMQMALINSLGAGATVISYGELYTAAQQGTVDGMLTATSLYKTDRFCEVIDYLSIIRATAHFHIPIVNKQWLDSLPDDLRVIFDECMADYVAKARQVEEAADAKVIESLEKDEGLKIKAYTEEKLIPFKEATKVVWDENYDLPGEGVMDAVLKYLGKERL